MCPYEPSAACNKNCFLLLHLLQITPILKLVEAKQDTSLHPRSSAHTLLPCLWTTSPSNYCTAVHRFRRLYFEVFPKRAIVADVMRNYEANLRITETKELLQ